MPRVTLGALRAEGRQCELALGAAHISYFQTPSWAEFENLDRQIEKYVSAGGRESHLRTQTNFGCLSDSRCSRDFDKSGTA